MTVGDGEGDGMALGALWAAGALAALNASGGQGVEFRAVRILTGSAACVVERNAAALLAQRLAEPAGLPVCVAAEADAPAPAPGELTILLGIPANHSGVRRLMAEMRLAPLTGLAPGPEGFLLRTAQVGGGPGLLAAAADERGAVYAAGEILRRAHFTAMGVRFPAHLSLRTAPAFELRGTQFGQSGVALQKAGVRPWTQAEIGHKIADFALAGANTLQVPITSAEDDPTYRTIKGLGLKTIVHLSANAGSGPPEWRAAESIGREGYLCPSVPEAREAMLRAMEATFRKAPHFDYVSFAGGDGGGCECDRCKPYGLAFIRLCRDFAAIVHRYHPDAQVMVTNQKFSNEDDLAIFRYLRENPGDWLRAFVCGPGSDAMSWQPGHRQNHRMDLFRYPGFAPPGRYLQEILHELPPQQDLALYTELTHWRYSQNGYAQAYPRPDKEGNQPPHWGHGVYERMPDPYLTQVYDRLTFFAWPRWVHRAFGETMRYSIGDCTHSSGTHDHANQWIWQRLLWNPQATVEQVVDEYARAWFGPEAAPHMARALFALEEYLQWDPATPLPRKASLLRYRSAVQAAGRAMPGFLRARSWLWREYAQKAAIDRRTQLAVAQQMALQSGIERTCAQALHGGDPDKAIRACLSRLAARRETAAMVALRLEALRLGEESNALYGVRSEGLRSLDHDFVGLGWLKRQLERALSALGEAKRELLAQIADYEDAGPGGFYDNLGSYESAPHLVNGAPYDHGQPYVAEMLSEGNRLSQRTMCGTQDEARGLELRYEGLDPAARYRMRVTLVRPWFQPRYAQRMNQRSQSIYADGLPLAVDLELPEKMSDFFTFDIPAEATADGALTISFRKSSDVAAGDRVSVEQWRNSGGWGTLCSEAWLTKVAR